MRYAILGDIHSNLTALETVMRHIRADGADRVVSVGDVVGYGAAPVECLQIVREAGMVVVKGNHDAACVGQLDTTFFNPFAREAVAWTRAQVGEADMEWLASLPYVADLGECVVSHGTLAQPERFDYIQTIEDADPSFAELRSRVCFIGHTHVPVTLWRTRDDPDHTRFSTAAEVSLAQVTRSICNVGSVGQPRDEDPRTGYALYDSEEEMVWIRRLEYDIQLESNRIQAAGLPPMLAHRLHLGV